MNTTKFFSSWIYYLPAIACIFYSIACLFIFNTDLISKINRIYYSICIFVYTIILKTVNLIDISVSGFFGITPKSSSILIFTIIFFIVALTVDYLIISGSSFKEIGILGAKFIKDDNKTTIAEQDEYILSINRSIYSLSDTYDYMKDLFSKTKDDILNNRFDYTLNLHNIIEYYYKRRFLNVDIDFTLYNNTDIKNKINQLGNKYNFSNKIIGKLENNFSTDKSSYYVKAEDFNVLIISLKSSFLSGIGNNILLEIKSLKQIDMCDKIILKCIFKQYEMYL